MKSLYKNFFWFLIGFAILAYAFSFFDTASQQTKPVDLNVVISQINNGEIAGITVKEDELDVTLKNGAKETSYKETSESFSDLVKNFSIDPQKLQNVSLTINKESGWSFWLLNVLPFVLPFILIGIFIWLMTRQVQGANNKAMMFGQSSAREFNPGGKEKITFKNVAGVKEAKEELKEVVEFLRNPKKFLLLGAKIPKGVLLVGAPGTGKTLLAKAVAGEANVPFFSISGSEFVEMFVGVGASRVRDLFKRAKKAAPCIVFIDELDAVGRQRGAGLGGSHDEREQTLNQILVEMDGFDSTTNIIVMAATNRPDILDTALLRPGRFDRRVVLDEPDINDREEILKIHTKNKPLAAAVNLRQVAERTPGFSGADLANLANEAAILTGRRNKKEIGQMEFLESIEKVLLGPERKSHILNEQEKKITAYHEAGHALVAHLLPHADPVHKVSIISRGQAAGYTLKLPAEDKHLHSKAEFLDDLAVLLAEQLAEKLIFGDFTTGAQNDLREATKLARRLVIDFGMSPNLSLRTYGNREEIIFLGREITEQRDYSEQTAQAIDQEINSFINQATTAAQKILTTQRAKLDQIAQALLTKETLEAEEFNQLFIETKTKEA